MNRATIGLVLSDVDGTLVTSDKRLTPETVAAVAHLRERGIEFAVTSGRPPRGLAMLIEPLGLSTPLAGFNGGLIVDVAMKPIRELALSEMVVQPIINQLTSIGLSVWAYRGTEWFVLDGNGPHVEREARACAFSPTEVKNFAGLRENVVKIVGVSDDEKTVDGARAAVNSLHGATVSATSSQTYYLDVTHQDANKGCVVDFLAQRFNLSHSAIAVIGDQSNDLLMFERAGVSVAVGNASEAVRARATYVSTSNDENGFAFAVTNYFE